MSFLEDFQAGLESLPTLLQRKYSLLRDLDKSLQGCQRQNEARCGREIEEIKRGVKSEGGIATGNSNLRFSDEAIEEQKHSIRIADEKVALAIQAYDLVDAHIQQLDQYLRKTDEEHRRDNLNGIPGSAATSSDTNAKLVKSSEGGGRGWRKKTRLAAAAIADPPAIDLDIPVDPNEPTYCFCKQVSFGEMVACDNEDCTIEWFHYGCVGLKDPPKGKWYCSDCTGTKNRRKGK